MNIYKRFSVNERLKSFGHTQYAVLKKTSKALITYLGPRKYMREVLVSAKTFLDGENHR